MPSDEISIDRAEPPEVEGALSTQNESQEARKLPDISITLSPPDNEENGNTGMGTLLEKKLADDTQGAEFHSEQQDYSNAMTDPGIFDLDNMDETLQKRLILNGANQPKSADMLQKAFPKSKHGSHFRSFNDSWYNSKVGKETVHRNWISYSPSKDAVFCHFCMFFGKGNKEKVFTRTGFSNWKDAQEKLGKHEKSQCHIDSTVDFINFCAQTCISQQLSNQARRIESERKKRVEKNRAVMKRLIEITVCLAKQGLPFRGHRENTSEDEGNSGNFLALAELISIYDETLAVHITSVQAEKRKRKATAGSKSKGKKKSKSGRGNAVSFLSAESQNKLIGIIGSHIQQAIVTEIKNAGNYSIAMDCTTDSAHEDQLSVIIRYVNEKCDIVERLLCIERVKDSSANGLVKTLKSIFNKSSINLADAVGQSYDGASVMRGKYNGVKTRIQKESPQCLFIWTFDHVLNLVIMEACGSSLPAKVLFGTLEKLYTFFSTSRKRSDILQDIQKEADLGKLHRPQRVSTTRWWSHQKALDTVFFAQSGKLYDCFRDAFEHCLTPEHSKETVTDAEALVQKISSFEMVITAHLYNKIFTITDPASLYLQSEKIDILTAIRLVETVQSQLVTLRGEFENVVEEAKEFCAAHELEEHDFTERRRRKRKKMPGEVCSDEAEENTRSRYRRETFIFAIDTAVSSIRRRFTTHKEILADFALLDPERFADIRSIGDLPSNSFNNVAKNYNLDEWKLRAEYKSFRESYRKIKKGASKTQKDLTTLENADMNRESFVTVLQLISKYNLQTAYPSLYSLYKILVTLPIGSTKCERSFSKLKIVKNRLRSSMGQPRLCALMLISVERELLQYVDYDAVTDAFATSPLLRKLLIL